MAIDEQQLSSSHSLYRSCADIIGINSVAMTEPDYLAIIKERGQGALDLKMGIEMLEVSPQRLVARMPVEGNTQPIGLLHGGANVVLAESLGSIGTQLHAGPDRKIVGVDINATHHKSATSGYVTAVATPSFTRAHALRLRDRNNKRGRSANLYRSHNLPHSK